MHLILQKVEGKLPHERPWRRCQDNIKNGSYEIGSKRNRVCSRTSLKYRQCRVDHGSLTHLRV